MREQPDGTSRPGAGPGTLEGRLGLLVNVLTLLILVWIGGRLSGWPALRSRATRAEPPLPTEPIAMADAALLGDPAARLALEEFTDLQCPYCGRFAGDTLPQIEKAYVDTGKVRLALRQFPLESLHAQALGAAEAATCAGEQGRFWEMHDLIFRNQAVLDTASLRERAASLRLDMIRFSACLAGPAADAVRRDQAAGQALGVTGTPTFFLGIVQPDGRLNVVRRLNGAAPFEELRQAVDDLLAKQTNAR